MASIQLTKLTESVSVYPDRFQSGIIRGADGSCLVIDTGIDKSSANKIAAALDAEGLRPAALLVTHTHADHCGGNAALHQKYGMPTYCPPLETAILSYPIMEPMYLYAAVPPEALRTKFFLATPTPDARPLPPGRHEWGGAAVTAIPLPGHSPDHTGYLTDDGVLFCGDALFPDYVWQKYRLPYFYDIDEALHTLDRLESMAGSLIACVAAHYGPVDLAATVQANRTGLEGLLEWVTGLLRRGPASREDVVAAAFTEFGLTENEAQYYLVGSTVAALLASLARAGKVEAQMEAGRLRYHLKG